MELQYKIILGLWIVNWIISLAFWGKSIDSQFLGLWLGPVYTVIVVCLISLGDIDWKHWTLIVFSIYMIFCAGIRIAKSQRLRMEMRHLVYALLAAPVFLWLLFS